MLAPFFTTQPSHTTPSSWASEASKERDRGRDGETEERSPEVRFGSGLARK